MRVCYIESIYSAVPNRERTALVSKFKELTQRRLTQPNLNNSLEATKERFESAFKANNLRFMKAALEAAKITVEGDETINRLRRSLQNPQTKEAALEELKHYYNEFSQQTQNTIPGIAQLALTMRGVFAQQYKEFAQEYKEIAQLTQQKDSKAKILAKYGQLI